MRKNSIKWLLCLLVITLVIESCSTCHSRRRRQSRKWYVEVGAKKCLNKKLKAAQTQLVLR